MQRDTSGRTLEHLWRQIMALGILVATFGALIAGGGTVAGFLGHGWIGLVVVIYAPERLLPGGLTGSVQHVLHYVIVPPGTLGRY